MNVLDGREYDIIVAGAGPAGFAAAVEAARSGARCALFEHFAMPGGILTVLGENSIDQFNNPFRPVGDRMVIAGIGWEFATELARRGFARIPDMDAPYEVHWQYGVKVEPFAAAQCMDDFLLEAGVELHYRQGIVSVETSPEEGKARVDAVIVSTKAGLVRHRAKLFIDCTGDGDLCAWAGAENVVEPELQPGTLRLYPDSGGADDADLSRVRSAWQAKLEEDPQRSEMLYGTLEHFLEVGGNNVNHICGLSTVDSEVRSQAEIRARRDQMEFIKAFKEAGSAVRILGSAPETAPREGRRILGDVIMTGEDYLAKRVYADAVCYTYWFIDIHRAGQPAHIVYLRDEETPTISLGALRPRDLTNVFTAGRCISTDRPTNSAVRVKASCMAMGQAAGAAAALAIRQGADKSRAASADSVRKLLIEHGAIVPKTPSRSDI